MVRLMKSKRLQKIIRILYICAVCFFCGCVYIPRPTVDNSGVPRGIIGNFIRKQEDFILGEEDPRGNSFINKKIFLKKEIDSKSIPLSLYKLKKLHKVISNNIDLYIDSHNIAFLDDLGLKCNKEIERCSFSSTSSVYYPVDSSVATEEINISLLFLKKGYSMIYLFTFKKE